MAEEWLEVRVDVNLLVLGVLVIVESRTIRHVGVLEFELD